MTKNEEALQSSRLRPQCRWGRRIPFIILAVVLVKSAIVMLLWNHLIPDLFHGPFVSFPQAIGLVILVKILLFQGPRPGWGRGRFGPPWARWHQMTPEERLKIREELHGRCKPYSQTKEEE